MPCLSVLCHSVLYYITVLLTVAYCAVPPSAVTCPAFQLWCLSLCAILCHCCSPMLFCAIFLVKHTVLFCVMLGCWCPMQCYAMLCHAVLKNAVSCCSLICLILRSCSFPWVILCQCCSCVNLCSLTLSRVHFCVPCRVLAL